MNASAWALVMAVVAATAFFLTVGWLLLRIESHSDQTGTALRRGTEDVRTLLRDLRGSEEALRDQAARTTTLLDRLDTGSPLASAAQLDAVAATLARNLSLLETVCSAAAEPGHGLADRDSSPGRHEAEVAELQRRLQDTSLEVERLRREGRHGQTANMATTALRNTNENLMAELKDSRRRQRELEARLEPISGELKLVRAQLTALMEAPALQDSGIQGLMQAASERMGEVYRQRLSDLDSEVASLRERLTRHQDELSRTLREKSFIEDRFIEITEIGASADQ